MKKYGFRDAVAITMLVVVLAEGTKLADVERMNASFALLGLPGLFGNFIGAC